MRQGNYQIYSRPTGFGVFSVDPDLRRFIIDRMKDAMIVRMLGPRSMTSILDSPSVIVFSGRDTPNEAIGYAPEIFMIDDPVIDHTELARDYTVSFDLASFDPLSLYKEREPRVLFEPKPTPPWKEKRRRLNPKKNKRRSKR